jgi:lipoprotein-releasing system permease protein
MNFPLLLSISKTQMLARKKQTLIAALGVTFGIGAYIIMMSFMSGLNDLLDNLILNRTPHVHLYNEVKPTKNQPIFLSTEFADKIKMIESIKPKKQQLKIHNALPIIKYLESKKDVKSITPQVKAQALYLGGSSQLTGMLTGVNVIQEVKQYYLNDYVVAGNALDLLKNEKGIVLGIGIAQKLSLDLGDFIQIGTLRGEIFSLKIVGLFQSGMTEIDNIQSYVNIKIAQRIMGESNDYITDILVKLQSIEMAPTYAKHLEEKFTVTGLDIQTANAQFDTGTFVRNLISYAVSITLLIVAGFGIYNILNMLIYEKINDIAILKATGFSNADVRWIFISQAIIIGIIGGILGLLLGYFVSNLIDRTPFTSHAIPNMDTYPVNYNPIYYIVGIVFAMVSTYFAGYFPSKKAGKIDPVDIIRGQ